MKRRVLLSLPVAALAAPALAQGFPTRPIRLIVPYPPGGGVDGQARGLARPLAAALGGTTIVVENRAGGSTRIGTDETRRAAPDGHTLMLMPAIAWVGFFHSRTFDTKVWEEMTPVAGTAETPSTTSSPPAVPRGTTVGTRSSTPRGGGRRDCAWAGPPPAGLSRCR